MRLFTLVGATVAAQTTFDEAINALSTRYQDLGLKRLDENKLLKKKTRQLHKRMTNGFNRFSGRGCTVDSIDHDFSLNINKRCNAKSTLVADALAASQFFTNNKKCRGFVKSFTRNWVNKYEEHFEGSKVT